MTGHTAQECKNAREATLADGMLWLTEGVAIDEKCFRCGWVGCPKCLIACFHCANNGDDFPTYCFGCQTELTKTACDHHAEFSCPVHVAEGCAECGANSNYSARHEMFKGGAPS